MSSDTSTGTTSVGKKRNTNRIQYLVACAVSLILGIIGIHFSWSAPTLVILLDPDKTPIPITSDQTPWIAGFLQIGSIFGSFFGLYITDTFGRKYAAILSTVPNLLAFGLIYFATTVPMLYVARFIAGIADGVAFVIVPTYISEISAPKIRGQLGIISGVMFSIGSLLEYCIVPYVAIKLNALICFIITVIQGVIVIFIPESPYYLIMKDKESLAEKHLKLLRQKECVTTELDELKTDWNIQKSEMTGSMFDIVKTALSRKCLLIILTLMTIQQFSGIDAVNTYSLIILREANSPISTELSGIILAVLNILFNICSGVCVDNWGRKPLFILSTSLSAVALFIIGFFYYLKSIQFDNISALTVIPICGIILYLFAFTIDLGWLPFMYTGEIFPTKFKASAVTLLSSFGCLLGIVVMKVFQVIHDNLGVEYGFWTFTACCILGTIFIIIFVTETKGKSLEQIQRDLKLIENQIDPS